jgi:hypothetical protein
VPEKIFKHCRHIVDVGAGQVSLDFASLSLVVIWLVVGLWCMDLVFVLNGQGREIGLGTGYRNIADLFIHTLPDPITYAPPKKQSF